MPAGRPCKRRRRRDGKLKLSANLETTSTNAGCLLYTLGLQLPRRQYAAALAHARRRDHVHTALRRRIVHVEARPASFLGARAWLHANVSSTGDAPRVQAERPLVLARTLFSDRQLAAECVQVALTWARFWALGALQTRFSAARGFGLHAAVPLRAGQVVARGIAEREYAESHYFVDGGGSMLGPAALANSACSSLCANALFRRRGVVWAVEMKRAVARGGEVLVHYPATGRCPVCGTPGTW